jgi:hypothetical protein
MAKAAPPKVPQKVEEHERPVLEQDLAVEVTALAVQVYDRGTLGVEIEIRGDDNRIGRGSGESVPLAFVAAWDAYDRPLLDAADLDRWADDLVLAGAMTGEERRGLVMQIAQAAAARAREGA